MSALIVYENKKIELTTAEWELFKNYIVKDTLVFWDNVAKDVDGGLLPSELAGGHDLIDRNLLYNLKTKLKDLL